MGDHPSILHELYVFSEWKPEPEYLQKPDNILPESLSALWRWVKFFGAKKSLIDSVNAYKKKLQKWQIALGDEGKVIAVVTDNILEIRTKRSEYATIAARTTVARDPYSQWRKVAWSPDCSFIALAYGNGIVSFFDLTASNLFNIPFECSRPGGLECTDTTHAVAAIIFMPLRVKDPKWNWEVLVVSFDGWLRAFLVSQTDGYKLHSSFRFPGGVGAATYCEPHNTLYVAGVPHRAMKDPQSPLTAGLTAWRVLNDEPYYKLSVVCDALEGQLATNAYQLYIPFVSSKNAQDFVIRMEVSPDHSQLVCAHCNGDVSVWQLPRLRLRRRHRLAEQPQFDCRSPLLPDAPDNDAAIYSPVDVDWWSNQEIIVSRQCGAVTICRTEDMVNILGQQPEFLQGTPQITRAYEGTFMALECESNVLPAKRSRSDESMEVVKVEEDTEDSMLEVTKELVKCVLYAITDMEAFQPRPRRVTVVSRVYRLLGVRSTTPAELFNRQIESGRYEEALALARAHALDRDRVRQQQWRRAPVSAHAIKAYLSKVTKKIWAVHQCVDRLPESLPAAKELLQFGLQLTNEKILEEINKDQPEGEGKSLEEVVPSDLNAYTSELLRCRHVMLFYRQRLALYESILRAEKSTYTKDEYHRLRSNNLVYSACEIAKEGRIEALTCLWPNLKTTAMQLTVLDNLPETIDPLKYQHLLPTAEPQAWFEKKSPIKVKPTEDENDWCKKEIFRSIWSSNWSEDSTPDAEAPSVVGEGSAVEASGGKARAGEAGADEADAVGEWYLSRARAVEARSGLASHALALLRLAAAGGVRGLRRLTFHLLTLDTLLYDINLEDVSLERIESLSVYDTCHLLMTKSTPATFVSDLKEYVLPFLKRYEEYTGTENLCITKLGEYLMGLSVDDLTYILLVVEAKNEFDMTIETQLELVEKCLLAYSGTEQLDLACELLNIVLKESGACGGAGAGAAVRRVGSLERLVAGSSRLAWRGVRVPLATLRERARSPAHAAHLLNMLARSLATGNEKPTQQDWENLLKDMLELQSIVFDCLSVEKCYEMYLLALMTSGEAGSIRLAGAVRGGGAARLALDAAREYTNSAGGLADPALDLARCCLDLIQESTPEIEEERELLAALKILHSFNLEMLPVQVRLSENRLELIDQCLESDPSAYLASHKLLKLAKLLRIAGDDEALREGLVLERVGWVSLRAAGGGAAARAAAARLAALRHAAAAPLLARVAAAPAPADAAARRALLAAALAHCQPARIEEYLRARLQLQVEGQQAAGAGAARGRPARWPSTDDEFADAITTPIIENKDLVAPPDQEKKVPLVNYLLDAFQNKASVTTKSTEANTPERWVQCPEFYRSLYPQHSAAAAQYGYDRFALPDDMDGHAAAGQAVLNWYYTQNCLEDNMNELETDVVQRCGLGALGADTALGVACLLRAARGPGPAPPAAPAAAAAALYATLLRCAAPLLADNVYLTPPKQMAEMTLKKELGTEAQLAAVRACLARLGGAGEVAQLRALGLNVNGLLYNADPDYRREVISRLAMSEHAEQWALCRRLARRHALDAAALWLQRAAAPPAPFAPDDLPDELRTPDAFARVRDTVWPALAGDAHGALLAYFSALRHIDDKALAHGLTAHEHIKLLKKAKAASPNLNYKLIVEPPSAEAVSEHLLAIMSPETVGLLTKFLRTLPAALRLPVPVNHVYTNWLTKYFFSVGGAASASGAPSSKKWMQQYRQCASYFNKLAKDDLLRFIENTCFSPEALARVPSGTRNLMIMQAVDYCQQEQENDFKFNKNEQSWAAVGQELARWARFLENYHLDAVRALRDACAAPHDDGWQSLEMSHGSAERVWAACGALALCGALRAGALAALLTCLHAPRAPHRALSHALEHLVHTPNDMEMLATRLTQYHKEGAELPEELVERAAARAAALALAPHRQLGLLALARRAPPAAPPPPPAAALPLLRAEWPHLADDITEEVLSDSGSRRALLLRLSAAADTPARRAALAAALRACPPHGEQGYRSVHSEYLLQLLRGGAEPAEALLLIRMLLNCPVLDYEEVKWLAESADDSSVVNAIWIVLLSKCDQSDDLLRSLLLRHKVYSLLTLYYRRSLVKFYWQ
ncbi:NBAS subunit of NRZ tethering complex-like isoform X1 [Epargyreus clarus]|uniref:NBAS subunit of NRZ tethering complex-like isoform X1 n=1 Tax=Epargyreus clarus TaxID=520877 RepID=UPI003C30BA19